MSIYQLYAGSTGPSVDAASFDVQFDGAILAYDIWVAPQGVATDADYAGVEISFLSSSSLTVNDARGVIASIYDSVVLNAAGQSYAAMRCCLSGLMIPVTAGERIHMHISQSAGNSLLASSRLYVEDAQDPRLRRRR